MFLPTSIRWLPYTIRRHAFSCLWKEEYEKLQRKRHLVTEEGYSFNPFDQRKCIFVHIPKAAGISVCTSLFGNLAGGHTSLGIYQIVFSKEEFESYFKFTFVRNPWDRLFSAYNFLKKGGINDSDRSWAASNLNSFNDFGEFVRNWVNKKNVLKYIHFIPQYNFLCTPYKHEPAVDYIGHYENIESDYNTVQTAIFNNTERPLQYRNKTISNIKLNYRDFYDDETRTIVADVYEKDIAILGYDFNNSAFHANPK